jgi:hypothetical protein
MAVHVAKSAEIHEDVEAELLARAKRTVHLIVWSAMPKAKLDDLKAARTVEGRDRVPQLAI